MNAAVRLGTAGDWPACAQMDVSYQTAYVWQLRAQQSGETARAEFTRLRLPRTVTSSDPGWGNGRAVSQRGDGVLLVAERNARLVGFAIVLHDERRGMDTLPMLAVAPHARRQGVARQLLQSVVETSMRRGRRALRAAVQARNDPAICLLRGGRFALSGYDEQFYAASDVALFFARHLRAT